CDGRDLSNAACRLHLAQGSGRDLLPVRQYVVSAVLRRERRLLPRGAHALRPLALPGGSAELQTVVEGYLMTDKGLRRLGSGVVDSSGGKMPIGLVISSAAKVEGEMSGRTTIEGAAKRTAKEIADQLRVACQRQGWI